MSPLATLGRTALLLQRTLAAAARGRLPWREALVQLHELGVRSAWLVAGGMAFFGAVLVTIADAQARRFTGNLQVVGPAYFELLVREFGPVMSAILVAARAGASHGAELATMAVREQVEALEMSAGDPLTDLVAPRLLAGALGVPLLASVGTLAASVSAALTARWAFQVDGWAFVDARFVDAGDVAAALLKALACGVYIPLAAAVAGLRASGGTEAVGVATTRAVVTACLGCLVIDFCVALALRGVGL